MSKLRAQELLADVELRQDVLADALDRHRRAQLGQFFTPALTARFVATMLDAPKKRVIRLLDPGAGMGILSAAAVVELVLRKTGLKSIEVVAYEADGQFTDGLRNTLIACERWTRSAGTSLSWDIRCSDYITDTVKNIRDDDDEQFDAIIMNPPYRKIKNDSRERLALEAIGLRVANLYTAFLALAVAQLKRGGALAAITPRSFANGLYHEPFRRFFFEHIGVERLHVFESRGDVFANADVLQENIIIAGRRGSKPRSTKLSVSYGAKEEPQLRKVPYDEIIQPGDQDQYLRIPTDDGDTAVAETMKALPATIGDLEVKVSTGRVVDFRARKYLRQRPSSDTVPLIYPGHLRNHTVVWPATNGSRKPNAIQRASGTHKLFLPNETYVLVKRFSSKEERRRVAAAVMTPVDIPGEEVGIENHLNVYHNEGRGLHQGLARGLAAYLNSNFVDRYVRQFNGHTQINATDLRHLRYPSREQLCALGDLLQKGWPQSQEELDQVVAPFLGAPYQQRDSSRKEPLAVTTRIEA